MKSRTYSCRHLFAFLFGVLALAAVGLLWWSPWAARQAPEPVYNGEPLSYWLANVTIGTRQGATSVTVWRGTKGEPDIIRQAMSDSNAVPFAIKALKRDTWFAAAYYRQWLWPKLPRSIRKHLPPASAGHLAVRSNAALFLGMGQDDERIVLALVRALKEDDNPTVRWNAAWALGNLGNRNRTAAAALSEALKDKDPGLRNEATNVLLHLDPEAAAKAGVKVPPP